jgi:hypothetical protein
MRFKIKPGPKSGDQRIRKRFLWLPLIFDGVFYFWETVWVKEWYWVPNCECRHHTESCCRWITLAVLPVDEDGQPFENVIVNDVYGNPASTAKVTRKAGPTEIHHWHTDVCREVMQEVESEIRKEIETNMGQIQPTKPWPRR